MSSKEGSRIVSYCSNFGKDELVKSATAKLGEDKFPEAERKELRYAIRPPVGL